MIRDKQSKYGVIPLAGRGKWTSALWWPIPAFAAIIVVGVANGIVGDAWKGR